MSYETSCVAFSKNKVYVELSAMESPDNKAVVKKSCESLLSLGETVVKIMKVYLSEIQSGDEELIQKRLYSVLKVMLKCMSGLCKQSISYTEYLSNISDLEENNVYKHLIKYITAYKQNSGGDIPSDVSTQTDETEGENCIVKKDCDNVSTQTDIAVKEEEKKHLPDGTCDGVEDVLLPTIEKSKEALQKILTLCNDTNSNDENKIVEMKRNTENEGMPVKPEIKSEDNDANLESNDYTMIHEEIMLKNESDEEDFHNISAKRIGSNQRQNGDRESAAQISPYRQDLNNLTDCSETSIPDFTLQLSQDEIAKPHNMSDFQIESVSSPILKCNIPEPNYKVPEEIIDSPPPKLFGPFIEIDLDELNRSDIFYETESSSESVLNTSQQLLQRRAVNLNATNNNECSTARENVSHTKSSEAEHNNNQTPGKRSRTKSVHDHDCIGCAISPECSTQKRLKKRSPAKSPRRSKKCK